MNYNIYLPQFDSFIVSLLCRKYYLFLIEFYRSSALALAFHLGNMKSLRIVSVFTATGCRVCYQSQMYPFRTLFANDQIFMHGK